MDGQQPIGDMRLMIWRAPYKQQDYFGTYAKAWIFQEEKYTKGS